MCISESEKENYFATLTSPYHLIGVVLFSKLVHVVDKGHVILKHDISTVLGVQDRSLLTRHLIASNVTCRAQ